ncbi:MAG: TonB-dependent receptor [Gemmatimonadetes bacterium]|nr:TonB-dependent receptor [Gemmatimonadota bacterium]
MDIMNRHLSSVSWATLSVGALALALTSPAHAQQGDPVPRDTTPVALPEIVVIGSILPSIGPAVGSGTPARVEILQADELRGGRPRLLSDALAGREGFSLYDDLGSPFKTTLVTRGFAASPVVGLPPGVSVFLDGVPVNEPDAGQVNFDLLPLEHVERVELLSGTASLLGPNSLGGAVNLVTRRGAGGAEVEASLASFGAHSATASVGGGLARGWSYYLGGSYADEGGWRQLTKARLGNLFASVGRSGRHGGIRLQVLGATSRAETAGSLPLSVYRVRPDSNLTAGDFEDLAQLHVALAAYTRVGTGRGSLTAYLRHHDAERFNVNQAADPDVRSFSRNRTAGANADWRTAWPVGRGTLGVRAGVGGSLHGTSIRIFAERIDPRLTTHVRSPIREADAYGIADFQVGRLTLSGGLRHDAIQIPFRNRLNSARDTTSSYFRFSPRLGVGLEAGRGITVYASAGQSFRPPAVIELACADPEEPCPLPFALGDDPPLDPVVATTAEIGSRWTAGPLSLSVSAYRTGVRNDIFLFPYDEEGEPEGSTIDGYFANIEATRREGVELGSRVRLAGDHRLYLNYAFTRATFRTDDVELFSIREADGRENEVESGDRLPLVPEHTLALGGMLRLPAGFHVGGDGRYVGRRWRRGDEANDEEPLAGYFLADTRLGFAAHGWEVDGIVQNLLGTRYATFGTFNLNQGAGNRLEDFLAPGQPRRFVLAVRREWR